MRSPTALFCLLVLVLPLTAEASSSSSGSSNHNFELSGQALVDLYNSRVSLAERLRRPFGSSSSTVGWFSHSGVRVTLTDNPQSKWLIHKGNNYGVSSQTVVTNANNMGSTWRVEQTKDFMGTKTVGELVRAGGRYYSMLFDNCHQAAGTIMGQ